MKKIFIAVLLIVVALCGCDTSKEEAKDGKIYEISFIDDDGNQINLEKPAERIISLYSAHTENIYYLGAGEKLIGNYKTGTYPPQAAFLPMYDYSGDPEAIIGANPDVVLIRPFVRRKAPDYIKQIENAGIKVVSLYPDKFEEFDEYIKKLSNLTGTEENAEKLIAEFHKEIDDIKSKTSKSEDKQTIFFESTETNIRTVTADSMAGLAIEFAGGENVAKDAPPIENGSSIAEFGEENVLINAENIDVYVSQRGSMNSGANKQGISERNGFETIKAIKNGRFFTINEKLISSPSFRYTKGVREIARYLYPEIMDSISEYENDNIATRRGFANILFNKLHFQIYVPSSSSYYKSEHSGHTFGLFEDLDWQDKDFDEIEACVEGGYIEGKKENGKEYFYPENNVTRDELAQTIFVLGDFSSKDENIKINDIDESSHKKIVQTLVDNGVFTLENNNFEPKRNVTNNEIIKALEFVRQN